ncbi:MAG: thiol peroxidase [Campylobacteraceae bacterium]|nr:thiol peroxidase [Campylobacteraceae bacterium]
MSVTFNGNVVKLADKELNVGEDAPEVVLVGGNLSPVKVGGKSDKVQILVAVPSLDTPVCASEARRFNVEATKLDNVSVVIVSMDLPFASGRFCTTENINNLSVASDFRKKEFSKKYGILIGDGVLEGLCARAIFVVGKDGKVVYKEIVSEVTKEPDYQKAIEAVKSI